MIEIWTNGKLTQLSFRASSSAIKIVDRFEATAIDPPDAPSGDGAKAWGQYLDDEHHSKAQWGFYGTSAGVQALADKLRVLDGSEEREDGDLIASALKQLPEEVPPSDPRFSTKAEKGDFDNIVKLAFIADGLRPDKIDVHDGADTPPIVATILDRAVGGKFWSSRQGDDEERRSKERFFPTAYVVMVLQRYQRARRHPTYRDARVWLAKRYVHDATLDSPANNALVGLALLDPREDVSARVAVIDQALRLAQSRLTRWAAEMKDVVIDRPIFYGFSLGTRTDYCFLHPEILAALYFLRRGSPKASRAFVLRVMRTLTDNVLARGGFIGQNGVMSTVDQLWAMRLITEFRQAADQPRGSAYLLPVRDQRALARTWPSRIAWASTAVLAGVSLTVLATGHLWAGIAAGLGGTLIQVAALFVVPLGDD